MQAAIRRPAPSTRRGMSSLEVVMLTAVMFPLFAYSAYHAIQALRVVFTVVGSMVGSPLL
ncbi:hypothetical protein Poly24_01600 [Rosistilla carotiformis]|uniref:Uncharacterized protein n=1 Tax=Rosistilla carotiformis TaxID=2528017 RepID=A0A518JLR8_9BACT|nr:hypothetical protein [Rosistilla carotiformis]QDV66474.1 hypothetical protein Poly24_01600 [Rosistilla carotiformis]